MLIDGGTRAGDIVRLSQKPRLTTGLATVDPSFGAALDSTSTFIILKRPFQFIGNGGLRDKVNEAQQKFSWEKRIEPVTSVTDGDMLSSATTSWSEVGSGALSKVAATVPLAQRVLRMTGVAADDYIKSATIAVEPEVTYYFELLGMIADTGAAADTGTVVLYDETNAGAITLDTNQITIDTFEPKLLIQNVTMPAGCKQVTVRLEADNAGDVIDWGWVILRKNDAYRFTLADRPQRVLGVGQVRVANQTDTWESRSWERMTEVPYKLTFGDARIAELHLEDSTSGRSLWYEEFYTPATLTAVTDTTTVDPEYLAPVVAMLLLAPYRMQKQWRNVYEQAALEAARSLEAYHAQNVSYVNKSQRKHVLSRL